MFQVTVYVNSAKEYMCKFSDIRDMQASPEGQDIVCAAASVLTINTINAIDQFTGDRESLNPKIRKDTFLTGLTEKCLRMRHFFLSAMVLGLTEMSDDEDYAQYIQLTFEEV
ncbi:MAG: ribosomal-processing cysteine protease Prp [Lachnospiraceae bacterium]